MSNYDGYRYNAPRRTLSGTRWAYDDEIREDLTPIWLPDAHYPTCGLPLISDSRTAWVDGTDTHSMILGATGSKKTRLFAMPMMHIIARSGESVVCTDPKGELYERTSGLFKKEGYQLLVANLREPARSHGWNPLYTAKMYYQRGEHDRAISLINDLAASLIPVVSKKDPYWEQSAQSMLKGLASMLLENDELFPAERCNMFTLHRLATNLTNNDSDSGQTNRLLSRYAPNSQARINLDSIIIAPDRTFSSIVSSYHAPMQILYAQETLIRMLSTPQIDFSSLGKRKSVLFIIMPDEKTTLHPIVSLMVKQCYETLIATAQNEAHFQLPIRVNFLLDEFANIPTIPDMNAMISAARSRNIRFFLVVQAMNQLKRKYDEDAETIRSNCGNWVFLTSREVALLRELEELCGVNQATGEALISRSQLQRLSKKKGEALVLCGRNYPYISRLADIDDYPFERLPPAPFPKLPE